MQRISPSEKIELLRVAYNALKMLTDEGSLAGVILTESSYDNVKACFGPDAKPFSSAGIILDTSMENTFVVDGMLFLKGTQPK